MENCPYCIKARKYLSDYKRLPEYRNIEVEVIDEIKHKDIADTYDYYYVPCIYVDEVKMHEGTLVQASLKELLDKVIK